jgi:SAM-dependent methyltransferase
MIAKLYNSSVAAHFFPEINVAGFSHADGSIAFYNQVAALLESHHTLLEFGAGRGEHVSDDPVTHRAQLSNFKGRVKRVVGFDVDPAVMDNPYVDSAVVGSPSGDLPFADGEFDLIVSRYVFEHVEHAERVASELMRVLKPGGTLCALTPNKHGYVALVARLIPNKLHADVVAKVQPGRLSVDVFPTRYRMNTLSDLRRLFGPFGDVIVYRMSSEPAYYFGSKLVYAMFLFLHRVLPASLSTALHIFVRKR